MLLQQGFISKSCDNYLVAIIMSDECGCTRKWNVSLWHVFLCWK